MKDVSIVALALFVLSFSFTVCYARVLVPALRRRRAAQPILEIGPAWHLSKAGTPTMGGLAFIGGIGSALFLFALYLLFLGQREALRAPALVFAYGILCGAVDFYDDYRKLVKRNNQGLTAMQKYLLQLLHHHQ